MTEPDLNIQLKHFIQAQNKIRKYIYRTPLKNSLSLQNIDGRTIFHKVESMAPTGSFKVRGAFNKILQTTSEEQLITASSGNHAAASAFAAHLTARQLSVVVPETTPKSKLDNIAKYDSEIIQNGQLYDESEKHARQLAREEGFTFIGAFADVDIIAGQGTIALELAREIAPPATLVVPVGGGGLISGVSAAAKLISSRYHIIGVQPAASAPMYHSFKNDKLSEVTHEPTLSEATAGGISQLTFDISIKYVDEVITVNEQEISQAISHLALQDGLIAEGAGALATAAVLSGKIRAAAPGPLILILSGTNIDSTRLSELISSGEDQPNT